MVRPRLILIEEGLRYRGQKVICEGKVSQCKCCTLWGSNQYFTALHALKNTFIETAKNCNQIRTQL
jgi:hypothetical protein